MSYISGCFLQKKEMTKLWVDNVFVPVTLMYFANQEIIRYFVVPETQELVVHIGITGGKKNGYVAVKQCVVHEDFKESFPVGSVLPHSIFEGLEKVSVTGISKGKGFQGVMKRHNFSGGPATHGSKFHRMQGTTGQRKPRRTRKGFPMSGRMGGDQLTLHNRKIVDCVQLENDFLVAIKGPISGSYNSYSFISFPHN